MKERTAKNLIKKEAKTFKKALKKEEKNTGAVVNRAMASQTDGGAAMRNRISRLELAIKDSAKTPNSKPNIDFAGTYIKALANPETWGKRVGVPDEFSDPTMRYQSITEFTLGNGVGPTYPFGGGNSACVLAVPDIRSHVYVASGLPASTNLSLGSWTVNDFRTLKRTDNSSAFGRLTNRNANESYCFNGTNATESLNGATGMVFLPDCAASFDPVGISGNVTPDYIVGVSRNASSILGIPVVAGDTLVAILSMAPSINNVISLIMVTANAAGAFFNTTALSPLILTNVPAFNTSLTCNVPAGSDRLVGWVVAGSVGTPTILSANFGFAFNAGFTAAQVGSALNFPASNTILTSVSVPEYASFVSNGDITAYRLVSMSLWAQFDGGTLNDNGRIVSAYINDRRQPMDSNRNYTDLPTLASLDGAYDGKMPMGSYSLWKPESFIDTRFKLMNEINAFESPYIATTFYNPTAAGQQIRVRLVANWEMQTLSNKYDPIESVVNPSEIALAYKVFARFPLCMENEFHLAKIADFIKTGFNKVRDFYRGNKGLIDDVGGRISTAIPQFAVAKKVADAVFS